MGLSLARPGALIRRAGDRDRALFERFCLTADAPGIRLRFWRAVTRAGGAGATIVASSVPILWDGALALAARRSLAILVLSHLIVQVVKRTVGRPRPTSRPAIADIPDRFSFPSGHAAAAMSIAIGYAASFPAIALPVYAAAMVVGASRVMLGVHYPGDVAAGQLIALATAVGLGALA